MRRQINLPVVFLIMAALMGVAMLLMQWQLEEWVNVIYTFELSNR